MYRHPAPTFLLATSPPLVAGRVLVDPYLRPAQPAHCHVLGDRLLGLRRDAMVLDAPIPQEHFLGYAERPADAVDKPVRRPALDRRRREHGITHRDRRLSAPRRATRAGPDNGERTRRDDRSAFHGKDSEKGASAQAGTFCAAAKHSNLIGLRRRARTVCPNGVAPICRPRMMPAEIASRVPCPRLGVGM